VDGRDKPGYDAGSVIKRPFLRGRGIRPGVMQADSQVTELGSYV